MGAGNDWPSPATGFLVRRFLPRHGPAAGPPWATVDQLGRDHPARFAGGNGWGGACGDDFQGVFGG